MAYNISSPEVQMTLVLKLHELQRTHLKYLTYDELEAVLQDSVWKKGAPSTLHMVINDILSITAEKVVQYMSNRAVIDGYYKPLSDFEELLGGKRHE